MTLKFSERMVDQDNGYNTTILKEGGLNLSLILSYDTIQMAEEIEFYQNITVEEQTYFTWEIAKFINDKLYINVNFSNPLTYSNWPGLYDEIKVEVYNQHVF